MKRILCLLITLSSLAALGQQYPVSSISITLPPQPMPNTGDWSMPFVISAQARLVNGQVPGNLVESRILVTIKKDGVKFCSGYTPQNAPLSVFNAPTKTWSGGTAFALLGNNCFMPPGNYELCVQFYSSNAPPMPLSNEVCKSFTIGETNPGGTNYMPPQNIMPFDGKQFSAQEASLPIMFRWTPVMPKPKGDIIYKVKVVEVMPGQSLAQALSGNGPIAEKELTNETQTSFKLAQRCHDCGMGFIVEAVSAYKIPGGPAPKNYGKSDPTRFSFAGEEKGQQFSPPQNILPVDGKVFSAAEAEKPIMFRWTPVVPKPKEDVIYKMRIYEVPKGRSKSEAIKSGSPVEMVEVKNLTQVPLKLSKRCNNCEYVWNVEAVGVERVQGGEPSNYGKSEATQINLAGGANLKINPGPVTIQSQCDVNSKLESYKCLGKDANGNLIYSVTTNFMVNSSTAGAVTHFNDPINKSAPYCTTYGPANIAKGNPSFIEVNGTGMNNVATQNDMIAASGPFKATYSNGSYPTTYTIIIPAGTTQIIVGYYFYTTPDNATCVPKDTINIDAPCPCDLCETLNWGESGANATLGQDKNTAQISQSFSIPGIKIKQVTAEIIGFDWQVNEDCKKCLKESYGYFTAGIANGEQVPNTDASFPLVDGMPLVNSFQLDWNLCGNKRPQPLNGTFKMDVALPPATSLNCCTDQFNICIRYTILTDDCRTCSKVICYSFSRMP